MQCTRDERGIRKWFTCPDGGDDDDIYCCGSEGMQRCCDDEEYISFIGYCII